MSSCNKDPNNINTIYFTARLGFFGPFTGLIEQLESLGFFFFGHLW